METSITIAQLYYLVIMADGQIDEKEVVMGEKLVEHEKLNKVIFGREIEYCKQYDDFEALLLKCLSGLKKLSTEEQVRYIAWTCLMANADGFMDKKEWQLIYRIYSKELKLSLNDIMNVQRELAREVLNPLMSINY